MIIDAHVHLYPDKIAAKAAQNIGAFYDLPMAYDGSLAQLKAACQRAGVAACVLCSVATAPAQAHSINVFLADAKTRLGWAALCALHPAMAPQEVTAALDFAQAQGMVGAKLHPDFQRFCADDPAVFPLYGALAARGMPLLLHAGDARFRFSNPQKIARLLQAFPTLTVV
ncbi:MAG: amidohydrolase, partial [Oscillospiraceae bacterium]|nr:amidohydrolase [Oscillospiraceae bacterium]